MALSKRVLRELHQELKQLQNVRDGAIARIGALEALLSGGDSPLGRDRMSRLKEQRVSGSRGPQPSLRASVIKTLEEVSSSTASDMARHLEATGFKVGGATTLRERVAHELSRLRRKGVVRRGRNGHYELAGHPIASADEASLGGEMLTLN